MSDQDDLIELIKEYRFRLRGGRAADLHALDEVLFERELVSEDDTGRYKLGDGVRSWRQLPYIQFGRQPIHTLNAAPANNLGVQGDYAFFSNGGSPIFYGPKGATEWPAGVSLRGPAGPSNSAYFSAAFDGGNVDVVPGAYCDVIVPYGFDITRASMIAGGVGEISVDIRVVPFAQYPPLAVDSIVGSNPPRINGNDKWTSEELTGWNRQVPDRSTLRFQVLSCTGLTRAQILIEGTRT